LLVTGVVAADVVFDGPFEIGFVVGLDGRVNGSDASALLVTSAASVVLSVAVVVVPPHPNPCHLVVSIVASAMRRRGSGRHDNDSNQQSENDR